MLCFPSNTELLPYYYAVGKDDLGGALVEHQNLRWTLFHLLRKKRCW